MPNCWLHMVWQPWLFCCACDRLTQQMLVVELRHCFACCQRLRACFEANWWVQRTDSWATELVCAATSSSWSSSRGLLHLQLYLLLCCLSHIASDADCLILPRTLAFVHIIEAMNDLVELRCPAVWPLEPAAARCLSSVSNDEVSARRWTTAWHLPHR